MGSFPRWFVLVALLAQRRTGAPERSFHYLLNTREELFDFPHRVCYSTCSPQQHHSTGPVPSHRTDTTPLGSADTEHGSPWSTV